MGDVVIVDYGMGNIKSVQRGLEKVGASVVVSSKPEVIASADRLLLPGVGAFESGMQGLKDAEIIMAINQFSLTGNPLLGICLGMQMFFGHSEEKGEHKGLDLISGSVVSIPEQANNKIRKIPHIGWSAIYHSEKVDSWEDSILNDINDGEFFYFVHSYMVVPQNSFDEIAYCEYEGIQITAAVRKDNITGLQFHPEKSGEVGLKILKQFISG